MLARYVSTDQQGIDACEFLDQYFPDPQQMLDAIFLKGYQWPFDSRKIVNYGSSLIDILVHREIHQKGRRVFLDFMHNPTALRPSFDNFGKEAYAYLEQFGAFQATPFERLAHINQPAIDLYKSYGIDLAYELLEIAVCAQHNNGVLAVNCWWETNVPHLFVVGEAVGTHGVYRPGGSALNSWQAGSTRTAMLIAHRYTNKPMPEVDFVQLAAASIAPKLELAKKFLNNKNGSTTQKIRKALGDRMSVHAAHIRFTHDLQNEATMQLQDIVEQTVLSSPADLVTAFENVDLLIAQHVYAAAMEDYIMASGGSRGSCIILNENEIYDIPGAFNFLPDNDNLYEKIQEARYTQGGYDFTWEDVRPIPENDDWFENVWREYRDDEAIR